MAHLVEITPAAYASVAHIARRMREADALEIYPHLFRQTPEDLAMHSSRSAKAYTALSDGEPVAAWGAGEQFPKVWQCWMFATDRWPEVASTVTKFIRREFSQELINSDAVRLHCWSADDHHVAHRWLEVLGFIREATLEDFSQDRQTFHCYSITRSRLEKKNYVYIQSADTPPGSAGSSIGEAR